MSGFFIHKKYRKENNNNQGKKMITIPNSVRLTFSLMSENNKQDLFDIDQDPEVMKYINGGKPTTWQEIEELFIPRLNAYTNSNKGWGIWKVEDKVNHEYLGLVFARPMEFFNNEKATIEDNLELGWRFFKTHWGKGYGTEAAKAMTNAIANHNNEIKFFSAMVEKDNIGSIKIMEKLGMSYLKTDTLKEEGFNDLEVLYYQMPAQLTPQPMER